MTVEGYKSKLTAVFSAYVVGYSRLMGEDEAATVKILEAYKQIMSSLIKHHRAGWWIPPVIISWRNLRAWSMPFSAEWLSKTN